MNTTVKHHLRISPAALALALWLCAPAMSQAGDRSLNVLFIGNSFTARHNLSQIVKTMAEAGQPGLKFEVTTVLYGGRTLKDHWRLGTQNFVELASLTREEEEATICSLREAAKDKKDKYAGGALARHQELLKTLDRPHRKWDIVVLQSYRDDMPDDPRYIEYAPKFAELIRAQGARVVLYETTPQTQNEKALTAPPDPAPVLAKEKIIAAMAKRIGATVVPMAMVALHCQTTRSDFTLRFVNDAHLNQTMAYLTACAFYGALFDKSPEGLGLDRVTDIRYLDDKQKDKDRDGGPITRVFSAKDRADLQRIAWEGLKKFRALADESR
jgi:hypothetical protein